MTTQLKNLFRIKPIGVSPVTEPKINGFKEDQEEVRKRTYHEAGFRDGTRNNGGPKALSVCLNAIYAKFQNEEKELVDKQSKVKEPYINEQRNKETEIKALTISKENKQDQITRIQGNIDSVRETVESLKFEINDVARDPIKYHINASKGASTKFWIGLIILLPVTLYLFTFYISTSYSAFFKTFDPNSNLILTVLDAKALEKAWDDGTLEGAFVTLIPFVFLGLGYLIHMFGETKSIGNYFKIGILFFTTFVFDAILAYQIEEKIYELNKTFDSPPFDLGIAFTKIQFWGIIFAGFVVYIIWGVVFDFVMKEHKEKDKIKHEQQKRQKDIQIYQEKIAHYEKQKEQCHIELNSIQERIAKAQGRIDELQRIIDSVVIPAKEYVLYASEYVQGWITFINEKIRIPHSEKDELIDSCIDCYHQNLESVGASGDSQNLVYTPIL